jgi:alpha-L-fucosidase 2
MARANDNFNLWGYHPPFQIDCNFGYAAGVGEMLAQSQTGVIEFLPALPKAWPAGAVTGLRARGGYEVDIEWNEGRLTRATIHNVSGPDGGCALSYRGATLKIPVPRGESRVFTGRENPEP